MMSQKDVQAFSPRCGLCGYFRLSIRTHAPVRDFVYVNYRVCDWCDRANKGERKR